MGNLLLVPKGRWDLLVEELTSHMVEMVAITAMAVKIMFLMAIKVNISREIRLY